MWMSHYFLSVGVPSVSSLVGFCAGWWGKSTSLSRGSRPKTEDKSSASMTYETDWKWLGEMSKPMKPPTCSPEIDLTVLTGGRV